MHVNQSNLGKSLKAAYSGAMAFLGSLATVLTGTVHISDLTAGQWVTIVTFTLGAVGGTFGLAGWAGPNVNGIPPNGK